MDKECFPHPTKIIGVGDVGCTVVDGLLARGFNPDDCVMIGACLQSWKESRCPAKVEFLERVPTRGLDCGNDPDWCYEAAASSEDIIRGSIDGSKLNIIVAGMGGGIGTIAGPIFAGVSKETGALTMAVISKPFPFEGKRRLDEALKGIEEMKKVADMTVLISYDYLQKMLPPETTIKGAYEMASKILNSTVMHYSALFAMNRGHRW